MEFVSLHSGSDMRTFWVLRQSESEFEEKMDFVFGYFLVKELWFKQISKNFRHGLSSTTQSSFVFEIATLNNN